MCSLPIVLQYGREPGEESLTLGLLESMHLPKNRWLDFWEFCKLILNTQILCNLVVCTYYHFTCSAGWDRTEESLRASLGYNVVLPPLTKQKIIPTELGWLDGLCIEEYWLFVSSLLSFVLASCSKHMNVSMHAWFYREDHEAFTYTPLTGCEGTGRPLVWVGQMWVNGDEGSSAIQSPTAQK